MAQTQMTSQSVKFKPLGNRVLVKRLEAENLVKGGIIIPESARKKQERAEVIKLGEGKKDKNGNLIPMPVSEGDIIYMDSYSGQEVILGDEKYLVLRAEDIIAVEKDHNHRRLHMSKLIKYQAEARQSVLKGVQTLAKAVKTTLGPKGRNVAISRSYGSPHITKDGVSVAKEIDLEDNFENIGAQMVKEAASKTADMAGDGTTTATVIAEAVYTEALRNIAAGANPIILKRGVDKGVKIAVEELSKMSKKIENQSEIAQVAAISANNDSEIGDIIAQAMERVGRDGTITVEASKAVTTVLDVVTGMKFDRGFISPCFITDQESRECILEDAYVLIYEKKLGVVNELMNILQGIAKTGKPFLIIAEDVEGAALSLLVINSLHGKLKTCAVKTPGFGDRRKEMLQDIAILTGGEVISEETGLTLEKVTLEQLGRVERAIITKEDTILVKGKGDAAAIQNRANQIRRQIQESTSDYDKEKLQERLAKLVGGVATIKVGGASETEVNTKKDLVVDANCATKAAVEEGIVPGGATAYIRIKKQVKKLADSLQGDEKTGVEILLKALDAPLCQIAENAGMIGPIILQEVEKLGEKDPKYGYNALTGEYVNMLSAGIIDPTKVVRCALENATSVASMLFTTEAAIVDAPKEESEATPAHGMGGY